MKYNIPIEVTKAQYNRLMIKYAGIVAGREDNGKYYIKVWVMKHGNSIKEELNNEMEK